MSTAALIPAPLEQGTLAQLLDEAEQLHAMLESTSAEGLAPEDRAMIEARVVEALTGSRQKVDRTNGLLSFIEGQELEASREILRLNNRKVRLERDRQRIEAYCIATAQARGLRKLEGGSSTLVVRKCPPSVRIDDVDLMPAEFIREIHPPTTYEPMKAEIKAALSKGQPVPGCSLHAKLKLVRE